MNIDTISKLLKYLIQGVIIYLLFKYVPKDPMKDKDILIITLIVVLAYAVFENAALLWEKNIVSTSCACPNKIENMGNVSQNSSQLLAPYIDKPSSSNGLKTPQKKVYNSNDNNIQSDQSADQSVDQSSDQSVDQSSDQSVDQSSDQSVDQSSDQSDDQQALQPQLSTQTPLQLLTQSKLLSQLPLENQNDNFYKNYIQNEVYADDTTIPTMSQVDNAPYVDFNTLPSNNGLNKKSNYGESFLPPSNWYPVPPHPPVCRAENKCPVCPIYTTGSSTEYRELNPARQFK